MSLPEFFFALAAGRAARFIRCGAARQGQVARNTIATRLVSFVMVDLCYSRRHFMRCPFNCPRCFFNGPIRDDAKFCPRCGLADPLGAAADTSPVEIASGSQSFQVLDRIAIGSVCALYRCRFKVGGRDVEGVFKIARRSCQ